MATGESRPQEQAPLSLGEAGSRVVAEETEETSLVDGHPWPIVGQIYGQSALAGSIHPLTLHSLQPNTTLTTTTTTSTGEESTRESEGEARGGLSESVTVGTAISSEASASGGSQPAGVTQLPESIDEEVLAALPDSIRQEVLSQHAREQRARRVQQEGFSSSISPEFLSALPPNIQEEVRRGRKGVNEYM